MSKEQAIGFMLLTKADEDLKQKYQGIVNKYKEKNLTKEEQKKIILAEVIPLAKSMGFDFRMEDFQELLQSINKQLTDEELDKAVGGKGMFRETYFNGLRIGEYYCDMAPNDQTFKARYQDHPTDCPDYTPGKFVLSGTPHKCLNCAHFKADERWVSQ